MAESTKLARLLSDEDIIARGYKEVTQPGEYNLKGTSNLVNRKDFINNRYIPGGAYDPAIFGLVNNCKCYRTIVPAGSPPKTCSLCGITVYGTEEERSKVNGYYVLPYATVSPLKIDNLIEKMKSKKMYVPLTNKSNSDYDKLMSICLASYDESGRHEIDEYTDPDTIGLDALYRMPEFHLSINKLLVIPSVFYRPCYAKKNKDTGNVELNMAGDTDTGTKISALLQFIKFTSKLPDHMTMMDYAEIKFNFVWLIYMYHKGNQILQGGKHHAVRDLTRSTIESSIRATISPALDLKLNQIKVPRALAYHAIDEDIIDAIQEQTGYTRAAAMREHKENTKLANEIFEDIIANKTVCLLWRNPTLHKYSVNAVYPVLWDEPGISIPIELCKSMNADFDGDQVGVAFITDPKEYKTITQNMIADKLYYTEKSNAPLYLPEHEIVLGLYLASSYKESVDHNKSFDSIGDATKAFMNNEIEYDEFIRINERKDTYGRFRLEEIIGVKVYDLVGDKPFVKNDWSKVIVHINSKSDRIDRLKELREFGARVVTYHGMEVPFENIYKLDDEKVNEILNSNDPIAIKKDKYNEYVMTSVKSQIKSYPETNIGDIVKAGARVKDSVLTEIYAPVLKVDKDGNTRIERESMFEGITESTFINRSLDNRKVQQLKRGQVPLSGYITRQMVLSNSALIYDAKKDSPDKVGLEMTATEALYRTTVDGSVVRTPGDRKVRVRSCLNHNDKKVYKDEVSTTYNVTDGSNISINIATGFSEFMTQTALGLKHGRSGGSELSGDIVRAKNAGRVVDSGSNRFLWIDRGIGQIDKYYVSESSRIHCRIGDNVSKDQVIIELNKPTPEGVALGMISELLGISNTQEFEYLRKINKKCLCYAPFDCTSKFITKTNRNKVGSKDYLVLTGANGESAMIELNENFDEIIFEPSGATYKKGQRISTGIIDLPKYATFCDRMEVFAKFKEQIKIIFPKESIRSEVLEIIFKSIEKTMHVGRMIKSNTGDTDFLDRMYYGATSQALKSYFKKKDEYKLDNSLILSLLFPDDSPTE